MINQISGIGKNLSFKGHSLVTNPNGKKEYQFYLPTTEKNVELEVVLLDKITHKNNFFNKYKINIKLLLYLVLVTYQL